MRHADAEPTPVPAEQPSAVHRRIAAAVLMVGAIVDMVDISIVNVALPTIHDRLGASSTDLEWVVSAYLLAFAAVLVVAGRWGDRLGRRRLFVAGSAAFAVASLAAGMAQTPGLLVGARAAQGLAAGIMAPQVLATFRVIFPRRERGVAFGIYGATLGLASAVGVMLGAVLVSPSALDLGWRSIFLVNVPISVFAAVAAQRVVPETREARTPRPSSADALALMIGLVALVFALLEGRSLGWPAWDLALGAGGLTIVAIVVSRSLRQLRPESIIPASLLRHRAAVAGLAVQGMFSAGLQGLMLSFTLFLQLDRRLSPLQAGLTLLAFSAGGMVTAPLSVTLAERYGRRVLQTGAALLAVGTMILLVGASALATGEAPWPVLPGLFVAGAGLCLLVVPLVNVVLAAVPAEDAGGASGVFSTAQQLGGALGVAVLGTVFFAASDGRPGLHAFTAVGLLVAGAFAFCGVLVYALPPRALSEGDVLDFPA